MNFDLTDEQRLLQDSVARFVTDHYDLEKRNALVKDSRGFSNLYWAEFANLGWLGLPFSEEEGGFGGTPIDVMLLMEEFGKGLVLEPYLPTVVLGGGLLKRIGSVQQKQRLLTPLMEGKLQLAVAFGEAQSRYDLNDVTTTARREGNHWILSGQKSLVLNGGNAQHIIVSARTSGGQNDSQGITLFLVDVPSDGLKIDGYPTVDGQRAAELQLTNVRIEDNNLLGTVGEGLSPLNAVVNEAILAISAEAVGAMTVLVKDTVSYTQQRQQFGHALAQFQVLQHRMVDMFMEQELSKSLLYRATMEWTQGLPDAQRSIHALKQMIGTAGTFVGENAVQLHGGMGMTEELRIGHYFKRLTVINLLFGDSDYHLQCFSECSAKRPQ